MADQATQKASVAPPVTMTEAGFSLNVKMIDPFGQEVMLTFRAPSAQHAGALVNHYHKQIQDLINAEWQPLKAGAKAAAPEAGQAEGTPTCPVHGSAMRPGQRGGYFCPKKLADGSYCKSK